MGAEETKNFARSLLETAISSPPDQQEKLINEALFRIRWYPLRPGESITYFENRGVGSAVRRVSQPEDRRQLGGDEIVEVLIPRQHKGSVRENYERQVSELSKKYPGIIIIPR